MNRLWIHVKKEDEPRFLEIMLHTDKSQFSAHKDNWYNVSEDSYETLLLHNVPMEKNINPFAGRKRGPGAA